MAQRYYVSQFDANTYQIVDSLENREVCVCSNYENFWDAAERAEKIAKVLNDKEEGFQKIQSFVNLMSILRPK
jgi:hypothetical protein